MQVFAEILHVTKVLPWLFGSTNCIEKYLISCHLDGEILTEPAKGDQTLQLELTHLDMMFLLNMGGGRIQNSKLIKLRLLLHFCWQGNQWLGTPQKIDHR
jgi:hypothetical protein